jgi:hypothetical protein
MWNFMEQAKQLRDDHRLELSQEDRKTFGRVFQRLSELRVAQAKMDIDIENRAPLQPSRHGHRVRRNKSC